MPDANRAILTINCSATPPLASARITTVLHALSVVVLALRDGPVASVFTALHGAGSGLLTVAKGTLLFALFGPSSHGLRMGLLPVPARMAQARALLALELLLDRAGLGVLVFSSGLGLASTAALLALRSGTRAAPFPLAAGVLRRRS